MGFRPTQGDEKRLLPSSVQQLLSMEAPPSPLSSRPGFPASRPHTWPCMRLSLKSFTGVAHPQEMKRPGLKGGFYQGTTLVGRKRENNRGL